MISSLPGKASRTFVELQGLQSDSTCFLIAELGKFDIKRCEPGIYHFTLQTRDYEVIIQFPDDTMLLMMSFIKCNVMYT